jgi:hypothetical protein
MSELPAHVDALDGLSQLILDLNNTNTTTQSAEFTYNANASPMSTDRRWRPFHKNAPLYEKFSKAKDQKYDQRHNPYFYMSTEELIRQALQKQDAKDPSLRNPPRALDELTVEFNIQSLKEKTIKKRRRVADRVVSFLLYNRLT